MTTADAVQSIRFDVFGTVMTVQRRDGQWVLLRETGAGIRIPVHDVAVPADLHQSELQIYLDDLYHESASEDHPCVVALD
jgi:hypothetical protein